MTNNKYSHSYMETKEADLAEAENRMQLPEDRNKGQDICY